MELFSLLSVVSSPEKGTEGKELTNNPFHQIYKLVVQSLGGLMLYSHNDYKTKNMEILRNGKRSPVYNNSRRENY